MSRADLDKWERIYGGGDDPPGAPEPFVLEALAEVAPARGRALDVAGGLGRHAIALARQGLDTTLVDVSPRGLARAAAAAQAAGLSLTTEARDLEQDGLPQGPFDVIVVTWFLLDEAQWAEIARALAPGGHLVYLQPTLQNLDRHARPSARFLRAPGALAEAAARAGLRVVRHELGWDPRDHHTERLVAAR